LSLTLVRSTLAVSETLSELARVIEWQLPRFENLANWDRFDMG
jgi:hypothetical protein